MFVIPAKAGIQTNSWMPDQVRHDGFGTFYESVSIVIWYFSTIFSKANRFYRNQLNADSDVSLPSASHLD